jgi:hypothetical protein
MIWAVFQSRGGLETLNDNLNSKERGLHNDIRMNAVWTSRFVHFEGYKFL